mgnify:FL=1
MSQGKTKVYIYTRVSTTMQIDGYSLDAQKARMKAYADFNDYQIVGEYEDAGKSGKSIEGRASFCRMMEDIKSGKDGVAYVLVFKLSRFGRNAADVLSTLQVMQDFGVNLICVEDGIDSSKDAGKLMISVLSAVAEIERENIRVQTMEGRIQKAREGRWNGGFAPYGYRLVDGVLQINEDEAPAIRTIFEQYVNTDTGANGLSKYLETHGFQKLARQNGTSPLFSATLIRAILKNPVYCGKIAFGRRKLEKIHGTRNEYHQVPQENYLLVDGLHEGIVSEELWNAAQIKLLARPNDTNQSTAARRNRRIYYPPLSSAPFAVLECTATNAPNERKMAHPINLSLITVASTARCNVGKNAISTSKFRKKFWTTPWWRLSSN